MPFRALLLLLALSPCLRAATNTLTLDVSGNNHSIYSSVIADLPPDITALLKTGTGDLIITADNTYSGGTTINGGLEVGNGGTSGSLGTGPIVGEFNSALAFNRSDDIVVDNVISGLSVFTTFGTGSVTLTAANTFSSEVHIVNGATLVLGNPQALGSSYQLDIYSQSTLDLHGHNLAVGFVDIQDNSTITNRGSAPATLTIGDKDPSHGAGGTGIFADGTSPLAIEKIGQSSLALFEPDTFSGGVTLRAGTLVVGDAHSLGTGSLTIAGPSTIGNIFTTTLTLAATPQAWNADFTLAGNGDFNLGAGPVTMSSTRTITTVDHTFTIGGAISGATPDTGLIKTGPTTLILSGDNIYQGTTTISEGTLQIGDGGPTGSLGLGNIISQKNTSLVFDRSTALTVSNLISGPASLLKLGAGNLTLSGHNTYTGDTTINAGTLTLGNSDALGASGNLNMFSSTLDLHGNNLSLRYVSLNAASITNNGPTPSTLTIGNNDGHSLALLFGYPLTDGTNSLALVKTGRSPLALGGGNTFSGGTTLKGGTVYFSDGRNLGTGPLTIADVTHLANEFITPITFINNNALNLNASFTYSGSAALNLGTGPVTIDSPHTLTITVQSPAQRQPHPNPLIIGGVISGASTDDVGFIKSGVGTLILTGDSSYTGTTIIKTGTLQLGTGVAGGTTGSIGTGKIVDHGTLKFDHSNPLLIPNVISGKGSVYQTTGTVTLSGKNTYSGGTTLDEGTLILGNSSALGTGDLILNIGSLQTTGSNHRINVGGDLIWRNATHISLTLTPDPSTSGVIHVGGKVINPFLGQLTFLFTPENLPHGDNDFLIMTAAKGFGKLTVHDFDWGSTDPLLHGTLRISGHNLYFDDAYGDIDPSDVAPASDSAGDIGPFAGGNLFNDNPQPSLPSSIQPVPEPSTWAMLILGASVLVLVRHRKTSCHTA